MKKVIIRQGDVMLVQVDSIPADAKPVPMDKGRIVLAYGEVTGHAHAIADYTMQDAANDTKRIIARLLESSGQRYLVVDKPVNLTHEEHTPHLIPKGMYKVPVQVDMNTDKLPRRVAD